MASLHIHQDHVILVDYRIKYYCMIHPRQLIIIIVLVFICRIHHPQSTKLITTPNMNLTLIQQNRQIRNNSPPPLPPPPKHLIQMLGGDSSIYSTPHGSPQQVNTHKLMILNNSNSNTPNNNNISVDYSPNLLHVSSISKHESSTTGSFRQTDSGVTNMGGSLIDSEQYEPNTIVT
ncbi:LOW QUALITY PROTEIN: hypothetical protein Smp_172500 [Schistosoma mansoni]|uniref:hypothetical protein n=1 Tax=Schistosoma mansoni TaxID=6183 RepID=UPI00022DBF45|nr:LOW QUALITY PROTEIN: hypothetical protein Smp_172500 [Schistosoma mansoni]|eukprot:XP_018653172.1 LOW QUALITY PROTEIN: hypothetical protein Smp_172500 [Schistosoma mansoni]